MNGYRWVKMYGRDGCYIGMTTIKIERRGYLRRHVPELILGVAMGAGLFGLIYMWATILCEVMP